jgi:pyruvate ferredoxin oxidoreductase alpha subunit
MVCADGYILTHVFEPVTLFDQAAVDAFLPPYDPVHDLSPERPATFGTIADETNELEFHYLMHDAMQNAKTRVEAVAEEYKGIFGHYHGGLVDGYQTEDAEVVLVAMGSTVSTLREAVDWMRADGVKVGLLKIRCFRPFPGEQVREAVKHAAVVAVLDRALSIGSQGVLTTDVKAALYDAPHRPLVLGLLAGYGGREVTLETARGIVDQARRAADGGMATAAIQFIGLKPDILDPATRTQNGI